MICIVTVRIDAEKDHDPQNKQRGPCPIQTGSCTDISGAHHSYLESGNDINEIEAKAGKSFNHITRIEQANPAILRDIWTSGYQQAMKDFVAGKWKGMGCK